jgi:hypothetical protein
MIRNIVTPLLLVLIGFTGGLGAGLWDKVEIVNIIFYSGMAAAVLIGVVLFGLEFWQGFRAYRITTSKKLEHVTKLSSSHVSLPSLPKPELIDVDIETLESADTLFYPIEN